MHEASLQGFLIRASSAMTNPPPPSKLQRRPKLDELLPREVLLEEIFSRLPVKSVGRSRCVCKSWFDLLNDPSFLKLHLKRQPVKNLFHLKFKSFGSVYISGKEECCRQEFDFPQMEGRFYFQDFVGSDNGLVCISVNFKTNGPTYSSLALWNPTTKEYNILPQPPKPRTSWRNLLCFGYDPSMDDYKVVRVVENGKSTSHQPQVYSLRSNSWKLLQNVPKFYRLSKTWCTLNGYCYFVEHHSWNYSDGGMVFSFRLRDDSFAEMLPLPTSVSFHNMLLKEMGGRLFVYQKVEPRVRSLYWTIDLWMCCEEEEKNKRGSGCSDRHGRWIKWKTISSAFGTHDVIYGMRPLCFLGNGKLVLAMFDYKWCPKKRRLRGPVRFLLFDPEKETGAVADVLSIDSLPASGLENVQHVESLVSPHLKPPKQ